MGEKITTVQYKGNLNEVYRVAEKGVGNACREYVIRTKDDEDPVELARIKFQKGARQEPGQPLRHGAGIRPRDAAGATGLLRPCHARHRGRRPRISQQHDRQAPRRARPRERDANGRSHRCVEEAAVHHGRGRGCADGGRPDVRLRRNAAHG